MQASDYSLRNETDRYEEITGEELKFRVLDLRKKWNKFWKMVDVRDESWHPHVPNYVLSDIVVRVDKRKKYYSFFHNMSVSERKSAGLYAYWIVKFRPISIIVDNVEKLTAKQKQWIATINEQFASFILYAAILEDNKLLGDKAVKVTRKSKQSYHRALMYSLRFRNLTIDSMMLLVETMTPEDFDRQVDEK